VDPDLCRYNQSGRQEHDLYQAAGLFNQSELEVYRANGLLKTLQKGVYKFNEEELTKNSY